ncbi:hypothetical protein FRB94_000535 [Tulasnella sp. JGI-2019a]|nr:hypothetical protein FRB94_000535 [Tulasnella sp. JGI-2019a]
MLQILRPQESVTATHTTSYTLESPEAPRQPTTILPSAANSSGKEWRQAVGLTKDVLFVPATNTSVLGAGIEGKFKPINDPEAAVTLQSVEPPSPKTPLQLKGKEKAKYGYVETNETPPSSPVAGPSSKAEAPFTPEPSRKLSTSDGRPRQKPEVIQDLCPHPIELHWPTQLRTGRGMSNNGNTCFLNSVLQCLMYTPPLLHILARHPHNECTIRPWCAICGLRVIMLRNYGKERGYFSPTVITQNIKRIAVGMRPGRQEDAHEFLRELIESLQKSALHHSKLPPPYDIPSSTSMSSPSAISSSSKVPSALAETTWVHKIFGGKLLSRVTCHQCHHASDKFEACLDISLDLAGAQSVEQAFSNYVKVEQLDGKGADRYKCEKCKVPVNAQKQLVIHQAPAVLTVHLKRFTLTGRKITRPIEYPSRLNIAPYVSKGQYGPTYSLYGIISHSGGGPHSGHYVAHVKGPNGYWHEMNDEIQTPLRSQQAPLRMSQAYVLFYLQDPNTRLDAAVGGANGSVGGISDRGTMKKRKNRVESENENEEEEEGPKRPPLGGPEIAAAAARESERMSIPQRTLSEKIKAAQEELQKGQTSRSNLPPSLPTIKTSLVDYAGDDEDLGEPVNDKQNSPIDVLAKTSDRFIGPLLPPNRATVTSAVQISPVDVNPTAPSPATSGIQTISTASFYGTSKQAPVQQENKKRPSVSPPNTSSYKRLKHENPNYYRRRSSGLWQNNLHRDSSARRGEEDIPKVRPAAGSGIKKNMKPKKRLLM